MTTSGMPRCIGTAAMLLSGLGVGLGSVPEAWSAEIASGVERVDPADRVPFGIRLVGLEIEEEHAPIDLNVRPSIIRYEVALVRPRRLLLDDDGGLLVADWGAGTILRVSEDGSPSIVVTGLDEPAGLALDEFGNLFVAQYAESMSGMSEMLHSGSVVKVTPDGHQSLYATGLGGPTGLAIGSDGLLYVANFHEDAIVRIAPDGMVETFADRIPGPTALAFDGEGNLYAASSTAGTVFLITPMGETSVLARGLHVPSDLALDSRGHLVVSNYGGSELSYVDRAGHVRPFAVVPKGTIGHLFDAEDNLVLVNWDHHYLMKVVTGVKIPCPHCGQPIPVRFRPQKSSPDPEKPREEPAT